MTFVITRFKYDLTKVMNEIEQRRRPSVCVGLDRLESVSWPLVDFVIRPAIVILCAGRSIGGNEGTSRFELQAEVILDGNIAVSICKKIISTKKRR